MLLADLAATSAVVAATRSRSAKIEALSDCLGRAGQVAIVVSYLSSEPLSSAPALPSRSNGTACLDGPSGIPAR
ncbi:MAG TPA: hypothetical protein VNG13_01460 [Mycobacteriales bacterium]|nr:hypothetical protein [Mycobacteriales bacterium]